MLTDEIRKYIDSSVLCWLGTIDEHNCPNVSPKEIFTYQGDDKIIIANVASPQSVLDIEGNKNVCLSFVDVFVQKGYRLNGIARVVTKDDTAYNAYESKLIELFGNEFPFISIIEMTLTAERAIVAPSYFLYPEVGEAEKVVQTIKLYLKK